MVGLFSFLLVASGVALVVALVLLAVRAVKKKPKKPVAIAAAVCAAVLLVSFVGVGVTYNPTPEQIAERERIAAEKAAAKEAEERAAAEEAARREAEKAAQSESPASAPAESQPSEPSASVPASAPSETPAKPETSAPAESEKPVQSVPPAPSAVDTPPVSSDPESGDADSEEDFVTAHKSDIIAASKLTLDNYVSGYKIPLAPQLWTVAKFDDVGAVAAMVDATKESTKASATVIVVLTPIMEGEKMTGATPHYISVGDVVYGDDGYCDSVFSILEEAFGGQN